jgi:hypothetical protein
MKVAANKFPGSCCACGRMIAARQGVRLKGRLLCVDALKRVLWEAHASNAARAHTPGIPFGLALWAARQNGLARPGQAELASLACSA